MKHKKPTCPDCGGDAFCTGLKTNPPVYGCDACCIRFTLDSRVRGYTPRQIRCRLMRRWDQLADDVHHLMVDMRDAPEGTFTEEELADVTHELDQTVWNVMVNHRPRSPRSPLKRAVNRRARRAREEYERALLEEYERALLEEYERAKAEAKQPSAEGP